MLWVKNQKLNNGKYLIKRILGQGGSGITYLATNLENQNVVIKTIGEWKQSGDTSDKLQKDFVREVTPLLELRDPHIVQIYDLFYEGVVFCIVMEYIEGENLADHVMKTGVLTENEALLYVQQIGNALIAIHEKCLLHQDVKPQNIVLRAKTSDVVLIDFGFVHQFIPNKILSYPIVFTPGYSPIEQYTKLTKRGPYTDIYALSATLYFLLTKLVPVSAVDRQLGITQLIPPQEINPSISTHVSQAILKGMALDATSRFQSIQEYLIFLSLSTKHPKPKYRFINGFLNSTNQYIFNSLNRQKKIIAEEQNNSSKSKNKRLLLASVKHEVMARLKQSLYNAALINIRKELQLQQVKQPWETRIKIGLKPTVPLADNTTILEVFDSEKIAGKLLILGAPGAGKTTTQLELAQALVSRAEEQLDYPVPVLFNLSSWKNDRQSIANWLLAELKSKYGISTSLGKEWINNHQLLPLLDGLDELEPQRQEPCVHAINQFLASENRPLYLVVCSRTEEYSNYSTLLQLNGAIYLHPLTSNQICDYLTNIEHIELWSTISSNLDLLDLVKTPLLLSITALTSQEISAEKWQHLTSRADRLQYLLDTYIRLMLTRSINSRAYLKNKIFNARKTRLWLAWLAQQMQREFKTEFLIEEMQPNWLISKSQKNHYRLVLELIAGLIVSVLTLILWHFLNLMFALVFGLFFGLFFKLLPKRIELNEKIVLFKLTKKKLMTNLLFGSIYGLILWLVSGLVFGLISGLIAGLISGLIGVVPNPVLEEKNVPNQGIWKSLKNAVFIGIIYALIYGLVSGLASGLASGLVSGLVSGLFSGLVLSGGMTSLQHFTLRLILYHNCYIPWNYARFLNYCTERLFLQRIGGRYRFIHKLLQDHFAQMPLDTFR